MKVSPEGLFGSYANVPPRRDDMWTNPTFGMWNRQPAAPMPGGFGGAASTLGRAGQQPGASLAPQGLLSGQAYELAFRNRPVPPAQPGGAPTTPAPGLDGMLSPDLIRQILGGGGLFNFAQF